MDKEQIRLTATKLKKISDDALADLKKLQDICQHLDLKESGGMFSMGTVSFNCPDCLIYWTETDGYKD